MVRGRVRFRFRVGVRIRIKIHAVIVAVVCCTSLRQQLVFLIRDLTLWRGYNLSLVRWALSRNGRSRRRLWSVPYLFVGAFYDRIYSKCV